MYDNEKDPFRNASGCVDPTAYQAIKSADRDRDAEARFGGNT